MQGNYGKTLKDRPGKMTLYSPISCPTSSVPHFFLLLGLFLHFYPMHLFHLNLILIPHLPSN